jgi:hypothetical protein
VNTGVASKSSNVPYCILKFVRRVRAGSSVKLSEGSLTRQSVSGYYSIQDAVKSYAMQLPSQSAARSNESPHGQLRSPAFPQVARHHTSLHRHPEIGPDAS